MARTVVIWRPEPLTARLVAAASPAAYEFAGTARARAPSKARSSVRAAGGGTRFIVGTPEPVGGYVEFGTGPHTIAAEDAKTGGALRLANGRYAKRVRHPGTRAKPWLRPLLPSWVPLYRRSATGAFRGF